ncbi:hypothetical protein EHQ58_17465 [Leptospira ognonensis]|uniref:Uncharacterized protein n=1 Tax=Leptospira ognonensis TaxID=2484945 RepID=A0A4R9JUE3_9LEPT|nr:hypothetical protein [Leptospira ognonensis]TGL56412.1 hypothetical protein EHQ58_17465 [Leptospira ognonensis]
MKTGRLALLFLLVSTVGCPKPKEDTSLTDALLLSTLTSSRSTTSSAATITSVTPTTFYVGSTVTIKGTNLTGKTVSIFNGGTSNTLSTSVVSQTDTEVKLRITNSTTANSSISGSIGIAVNGTLANTGSTIYSFVTSLTSGLSSAIGEVNVTTISTTNSNSSGLTFSVSPSLPSGLSLNTSTGTISGIATTSTGNSAVTYTLTGTNTDQTVGGTVSGTLSLTIVTNTQRTARTCNSVGTAAGCSASFPFSCTNISTCTSSYSSCVANSGCGF